MNKYIPALTTKKEFLDTFEQMIDYLIAYNEDSYTDEILCDMIQDPDKRQEAVDLLLEWISDDYEVCEKENKIEKGGDWMSAFEKMDESADKIIKERK